MQDFVPLGTGNSRSLKSAVPEGTTWEQALSMLRAGTFPIDIGAVNDVGVAQKGDPLGKKTLFQDSTAALYGGDSSMVPDEAFQRISKMLGGFIIKVYIKLAGVAAGAGFSVTGMTGIDGESLVTDNNGAVVGIIHSNTATVTVDLSSAEEVDIKNAPNTFPITANYQSYSETVINVTPESKGFVLIDSTKIVKISKGRTVDLFLQGAGSGAQAAVDVNDDNSTFSAIAYGGSPGNQNTVMGVQVSNGEISCVVGAGGKGARIEPNSSPYSQVKNGNSGGNTTVTINGTVYTAEGGICENWSSFRDSSDGSNPFGSSEFGEKYGAEGGSARISGSTRTAKPGGDYGGGISKVNETTKNYAYGDDATGYGSGGGAGAMAMKRTSSPFGSASGGDGYSGCVIVRWGY